MLVAYASKLKLFTIYIKQTAVINIMRQRIRIKRDFLKHKTIKVRDNKLNRRFGVDITPLSR